MKTNYIAPLSEDLRFEVESQVLANSVLVQDGALTYYSEELNEFA